MALIHEEVYEAMKEAGASEEKARAIARAIAGYEPRFSKMETDLAVLKWMCGLNVGLSLTILFKVFS
jgi:predicted component of type VI protein secretion system